MSSQGNPQSEAEIFQKELQSKVPKKILDLFDQRDAGIEVLRELPKTFQPADVVRVPDKQRAWELCGLHFRNLGRFHEAWPIFLALYDHMLVHQEQTREYVHKGMPLVWVSDCHAELGHPVLAKRYLMLTTCEDAVFFKGTISPEKSGVYFRMVWKLGMAHEELGRYAQIIYKLYQSDGLNARFPEWILQELDHEWVTEYPSAGEASRFIVNRRYVRHLFNTGGDPSGKSLERLAHYLLSCVPGCRAHMRARSASTDYDVVCVLEGPDLDFRSEFGRYFLCECKDWSTPADFAVMAKFSRVLDSVKCHFGVLFSSEGITGAGRTTDAAREQLKLFQDRGVVVVVVSSSDIDRVANGANFITMLRAKYEEVRLDLQKSGGNSR